MKNSLLFLRFSLIAALLAALTGCETVRYAEAPPPPPPLPPQTYAVILFLEEGDEINDEQRAELVSFARDTLLASGLVQPQDQLIDDPERAELLFRGRVQGGFLTEIAGVPTYNQRHMVVLSQPRRAENRIWWDAHYPFGSPSFNDDYYYSGFPYPGPGWGYPTRYRDRVNRGRGSPHDYVDNDDRYDHRTPTERPDRTREYGSQRPSTGTAIPGEQRNRTPALNTRLPVAPHAPRHNTVTARPNVSRPAPAPAPPRPTYTPPPAPTRTYTPPAQDRRAPTPREEYYSHPPDDIDP